MDTTIQWTELDISAADALAQRCPRSNIMQSCAYIHAACKRNQQRARLGAINIDGRQAGYVILREAGIMRNLLHGVLIDRAPVWLEGYGAPEHFAGFVRALAAEFPSRFGRKRRLIPEVEDAPAMRSILEDNGFKRLSAPGYQTIWLDLTQDQDVLRANLRKNWRGSLRKAEKAPLVIDWDESGAHLPEVLAHYAGDKRRRGYGGADPALLGDMALNFAAKGDLLIGRALVDNALVGAVILLSHGASATYQTGWSSAEGRTYCATHRLLWEALAKLQTKGITSLDLGGVNDKDAAGVKAFKSGMGGRIIQLAGHYT